MPQKFNDSFLGNATVPSAGEPGGSQPPAVGLSAKGVPSAVDQADGLGSPRVTEQTFQADANSTPSGKGGPSLPQSFSDGAV